MAPSSEPNRAFCIHNGSILLRSKRVLCSSQVYSCEESVCFAKRHLLDRGEKAVCFCGKKFHLCDSTAYNTVNDMVLFGEQVSRLGLYDIIKVSLSLVYPVARYTNPLETVGIVPEK